MAHLPPPGAAAPTGAVAKNTGRVTACPNVGGTSVPPSRHTTKITTAQRPVIVIGATQAQTSVAQPQSGGTVPPTQSPGNNTPPASSANKDNTSLFMITPFCLALIGLVIYMVIAASLWKWFDSKNPDLAEWRPTKIVLFALAVWAWALGWRRDKKDKGDSKKKDADLGDTRKTNKIPDGHVGIMEFSESPIRFFCLSEGNVWTFPFCDIKSEDVRPIEFQVPATKEELGIELLCKDDGIILMRASIELLIDPSKMYGALFNVGIGSAKDGIRNAIISVARDFSITKSSDEMLHDGDIRKELIEAVRKKVIITAQEKCLIVKEETLKLPKLLASKELQDAKILKTTRVSENKAVSELSDAVDKRIKDLVAHHKLTKKEAVRQARLEYGLITRQEIDTGNAGTNVMVQAQQTDEQKKQKKKGN